MRNLFVFAVLGLAGLGWFAAQASAGPIRDCLCCKKCCLKLCAKQYNAFSPYCLDSISGCLPCQGGIGAGNGGYCAGGYCGDLPAGDPGQFGGMPMTQMANPYAGVPVMPQGMPQYGQGMVNPMPPNYYPAVTGVAPTPGNGR